METGTAILLGVAAASAVLAPGAVWLWFRARRLQVECDSLRDEAEAATEIAAAVPDGFLLRDIETGRSRCSRRLAVLLELARGTEGSAEDVIACFEPGPADLLRRSLENLYESGQGFSLIVPVADDRRTIQAIGIRAFRATGRPAADIVWFRDLARKGNGGQAISGDGHFRALVDALPFPVWMQGAGGEVLFSNAAAQQGQADDTEILSVAVPETPLVFSYALPRTPRNPPQEDRSADWFRVLETVPTAVAVYGPDAHLRFANAAFVRLWRLDPGWLQSGPRFGDVLDRLRDARRLPEVPDYAAFRKQQVALISSLSAPIESMMHLPDGTTLKRVMAPSPGGGVVFAYEDLSERLSLERSLNELNAVQRETLDNLFEGVAVFSADGHLRLSNPAFGALWSREGRPIPEDMHVSTFLETVHTFLPERTAGKAEGLLTAARLMSRQPHQGRLIRNDERVIEYATIPLPDGAVMVSFLDVTDGARVEQALRQRAEALGAANRLKSAFIANVSHEIRTPLTTLIGFAEILTEGYFGDLNRRQMEYGQGILDTSRNLMSVVGDILDLASIEAGMMALELDAVDVHGLLAGILRLVRERARHKSLTITFDCPTDIGWIVADERRLKQVFFNLMGNAIRFAPQRGKISLTASREAGEVVISVADNGPGMDPDLVAELTEPFRRGTVESNGQGAGLGLALVSRFIELHNGGVEFRTRPGRGTKVICRLPTGETAGAVPEESGEQSEAAPGNREAAGD